MSKMRRNFILDIGLIILLAVNLSTLGGGGSGSSFGAELRGHLHMITGIGLMLACLVHILLHIPWFHAVISGKAKGRIKLSMYSMVSSFFLLAFITGVSADTSTATMRFHATTGLIVVFGLVHHILKHARWIVFAGKKIIAGRRDDASAAI